MERFTGLLGLIVIMGAAVLFSNNRKAIQPRVVVWGLSLQFGFAFLVLKTDFGLVFQAIGRGVNQMINYSAEGSKFLFGDKLNLDWLGFRFH